MPSFDYQRKTLETLSEDMAIVKTEVIYLRKDMNKILQILMENEDSVLSRTKINQNRIEQLEKVQWQSKLAMSGAVIALLNSLFFWLITGRKE